MIYKIKDLMKVCRGSSPRPIMDYLSSSGYPWLKISDFNFKDRFVYKTKEFIKEVKNTKYVPKGTLILTNSATPGIPIFLGEDMCLHDGFLYFEDVNELINLEYLFYWFQNYRTKIVSLANGSVFKNLKKEIVENLEIDLPSIDEQNNIVNIISTFDKKLELNNKLLSNYMNIINTQYKNIENADSKLVKASEIADITIGKTPPRSEKECFTQNDNDMKWVSISDLGNCGTFIYDSNEKLSLSSLEKYNMKIVPKNTILLSFKLTIGRIAITTSEVTTNEAIAHFNLKDDSYLFYLYSYLLNFDYNNLGNTSSIGTAVNSKIIKEMPIVYPSKETIIEYNKKVIKLFEKINVIEKQNIVLGEMRDILVEKYFN